MLKTVGNPSTRYGDQTVIDGNLVIGTTGKGIDFSAASHAAGMTNELLNDYEEGTFTPTFTNLTTVSGTPTAAGIYTKIGRMVYFRIYISGGNTTAVANSTYCTAPFSASGNHVCGATSASTVADLGIGLVQGGNIFVPSWINQPNVVITGSFTV
jgi:hypothetical protein